MSEWTGGVRAECPAIKELKIALSTAVPLLAISPAKLGTVRNDGSRHTAGLAMDIMLHSRDPIEKSVADDIIAALVDLQPQMRWGDLIYTDWVRGRAVHFHIPGMPPYAGSNGMLKKGKTTAKLGAQHENHIHIDWWGFHPTKWPSSASTTGFQTALIARLLQPPKWLVDYMSSRP